MAVADFDQDGDADPVVNNYLQLATYHLNRMADGKHWLAVRARGTAVNRDAVGAELVATVASTKQLRLVGNNSYAGQSSLETLFGLGDAESVELLEVRWPDGSQEEFGPFQADHRVTVTQGTGKLTRPARTGTLVAGTPTSLPPSAPPPATSSAAPPLASDRAAWWWALLLVGLVAIAVPAVVFGRKRA